MRSEINNFDYQLAQTGESSIVFVAFRHIHCCVWLHRDKTKALIARAGTINSFPGMLALVNTMLVFVNTIVNRAPIHDIDAQNLSLNAFPGLIIEEAGLGRRKALRKDSA
jgi:hypothetical protein